MCEDEGTRGGVGTAEAARCGNGGKETGDARESSPQPGRRLREDR